MTACPACTAWEADKRTGHQYRTGCDDCAARGTAAWKALQGITGVDLDEALARSFPGDVERGRRLVWAWTKKVGVRK
jgi:hypothetical protein